MREEIAMRIGLTESRVQVSDSPFESGSLCRGTGPSAGCTNRELLLIQGSAQCDPHLPLDNNSFRCSSISESDCLLCRRGFWAAIQLSE